MTPTSTYYQQYKSTRYDWLPIVTVILLLLLQQSQAYSIIRNRPPQHPSTQRRLRQTPFLSLSLSSSLSAAASSQPSHGNSMVRLHAQSLSFSEIGLLQQYNEHSPHSSQPLLQTTNDTTPLPLSVRTRRLLSTTTDDSNKNSNGNEQQQQQQQQPPWTAEQFREAQDIMTLWSRRYSRRAALMVERIIRRVVQEQTAAILRRRQQKQQQQSTTDYDDDYDDDDDDDDYDDNDLDFGIEMATMYTCAIRAWANSGERGPAAQRAEEILETMQQRYMDSKNDENDNSMMNMKPGIEAFNLVLMAYARSGMPDAPQRALRVLSRLHDWYTSGATNVAPNKASYAMVLTAFAKTGKPDAPLYVKQLLEHFERMAHDEGYLSVKPDCLCHSAYVTALVDAMDRDFITGEDAATEIEAYIYQLLHQDEEARPDAYMFNMGLNAWSKAFSENAVQRASALMETFNQYHEVSGRTEKTRPTTVSYNFLLACCSRAIASDGAQAEKILRKMEQLEKSG